MSLQRALHSSRPSAPSPRKWRDERGFHVNGAEVEVEVSGENNSEVWHALLGVSAASEVAFRVGVEGVYVGLATETVCCHTMPHLAALPQRARPPAGTCRAPTPRPLQWGVAVAANGSIQLLHTKPPYASCPPFTQNDKTTLRINSDASFSITCNGRSIYRSQAGLCPDQPLYPYVCMRGDAGAVTVL